MIQSKIYVAVSMSIIFVLLTAIINYVTAFMRWEYHIFEPAVVVRTITKYLLSGIYMTVITIRIIALCIYTRNAWKTIFFAIIYMLADSFVCSFHILFLQKIWIGYYLNLYAFSYEYQRIPLKEIFLGIFVMLLYGIIFYRISIYRARNIDF